MIVAFDQYQRYKHVQEIVDLIRDEKTYKILEVGANEHKNLEKFLPNDSITYLDIEVPESLQNDPQYIEADATKMPQVPSESFDFVVALDVFEHIPKEIRDNFLKELHRVAKQSVIISAPYNSLEVINAEIRANEYYKQLYGNGFRWLEEHRENDLPDIDKTISFYKNHNINYLQFAHGSLSTWEKLITLHFLFADKKEYHQQRFFIDQYYNEHLYQYDFGKYNYRVFFVSAKGNEIDVIEHWINKRIKNSESKDSLENLKHLDWLEQQMKNTYITKRISEITTQNKQVISLENKITQDQQDKIQNDLNQINVNLLSEIKILNNSNNRLVEENIELKKQNDLKEDHIRNIEALSKAMASTKGWKTLEKFRKMKLFFSRNKTSAIPKVINKIKNEGIKSTIQTIEQKINNELQEETYNEWFLKRQPTESQIQDMKSQIEKLDKKPLISVVMPTYNTPSDLLYEAIESLKNQVYTNWELCICDDLSPNEKVWEELQRYSSEDKRIKLIRSSENLHIAGATNLALSLATGQYVGFLDHDDVLTVDALFEVVKVINDSEPDLIYSDEDKLEMDGTYSDPFFKPDWSPDYVLSTNYICHFAVYRKEIGDEIGWINQGYDGAQDYDFVLRFTEKTNRIEHISKILYHWRKIPGSTAESFRSKSYAQIAGENAVRTALKRRKINGEVLSNIIPGHYIVKRHLKYEPKVSIIIPTKDRIDLLGKCIDSIINKTNYNNFEIVVVNNQSQNEETYKYFDKMNDKFKVIEFNEAFNYSKMNNVAAKQTESDFILFLNNDTEVIESDWLTSMVEHSLRDEVGVVGAKLLYTNDDIQHAGVILGVGGVANHAFLNHHKESHGYFGMLRDIRNCSAVTAACMLVRREVFEEVDGFNETNLKVAFNDVDLCLKIRKKGFLCVWTPHATLYHHESATRTREVDPTEVEYMLEKWEYELKNDPYYNINFSRKEVNNSYSIFR